VATDVFTLDGDWKGKFAGYHSGNDGRTYLVVRKTRILRGTARRFKYKKRRSAHKYLDYLYKQSESKSTDKVQYYPVIAMVEDEGYDMLPLDNPKTELLIAGDKVQIYQRNRDWLPMPLMALLEQSPSARDDLAELYTLYTAYLRGERPILHRQLELYKQIDRANQKLINTLRYENDQLLRTSSELASVVNAAYRQIADLDHALEFFNDLYEAYRSQSAGWEQAFAKAMEAIPLMTQLVDKVREQMSKALDLSMQLDVEEWSGKQAMLEMLQQYRKQLEQVQKQAVQLARAPASAVANRNRGGENVAPTGKEGSSGSQPGSQEGGSSAGEGSETGNQP